MSRCLIALLLMNFIVTANATADDTLPDVIDSVQPKMVKIYGSGGIRGLEAYQSGFLISPEGHVLTVWSYVLDSEDRAYSHEVQLGEFFADGVHLRSGVEAGARVVVSGQQKLRRSVLTAPQVYEPSQNPNLDLGRFGPLAECEL